MLIRGVPAEGIGARIEATPWVDVHRAQVLSQASLRYADAVDVASAGRRYTPLLAADARIARSAAPITCQVITVGPQKGETARSPRQTAPDDPPLVSTSSTRAAVVLSHSRDLPQALTEALSIKV